MLEQQGFKVTSYDAVSISYNITDEAKKEIEKSEGPYVFTSKNGVFASKRFGLKAQKCYAISPVTSGIATKEGYEVIATGQDSNELAESILKNNEQEVIHLTTADRRENLALNLSKHGVKIHEHEVYFKNDTPKNHQAFHALLVFAPSQLKSFNTLNTIESQTIYCIGKTTANYAKNLGYTQVKFCEISSEEELITFAIKDINNE